MELPRQETISQDRKLLEQIAAGDQSAFSEFYDRYSSLIFSFVSGMLKSGPEVDDIFQAVLLQIWDSAAKYDVAKGKPATWVLTIARNKAIDHIRSKRRQSQAVDTMIETGEAEETVGSSDSALCSIVGKEQAQEVRQALDALNPDYRKVLELAYFKGLTQIEISDALNEPLGTIKARARRGMLQLRDKLNHLL